MASLEAFVIKVKPTLDLFLRSPTKENLANVEHELTEFNWMNMKIFHAQILLPLVMKLDEWTGRNQDLSTGTMNCIRLVLSKLYLTDVKGLRTILVIVLQQIRERDNATLKSNLSEEIKLAAVLCLAEAIRRSTTDVLEEFYKMESAMLLGQILLTCVELIEREKYKKLVISTMQCLMAIFYVHDEANSSDVVLRSQVADTLFIFLPKIVTVLFKTCMADDKFGELFKATAVKSLGRILCVIYEETTGDEIKRKYNRTEFRELLNKTLKCRNEIVNDEEILLGSKKSKEEIEERLKRIQTQGRSKQWFDATSRKLNLIFVQTSILRSHESTSIRYEYANMCSTLMQHCPNNLKNNFIHMLENVVAMAEDDDRRVRTLCREILQQLQENRGSERIFDENADLLFNDHMLKLPRIINRCDEAEQYAELIFIKGFFHNISPTKLQLIFALSKNLEMFTMCLLCAVDLKISQELLNEEYALRQMNNEDVVECMKLHWRQFKHLSSKRCIQLIKDICAILGGIENLNFLFFDYLLELLTQQHESMNEIILIMLWIATGSEINKNNRIVALLLDEILNDKHWHLALQPDHIKRLKVDKPSQWFVDRTPGLYESAVEIRTQDYDSDDENDVVMVQGRNYVSISDAEFNVLHTCIVLDAVGHCATFLQSSFDKYMFRSLHRVLLKAASSTSIIYQAANFALLSMQKALKFAKISHFIETHADYITYHLNTILKRFPESKSAVDILTVVLQFSSRNALPHMTSIFQTIRDECSKAYQAENINSYLKVFNAFLNHISRWQSSCDNEMKNIPMQVNEENDTDWLSLWLSILEKASSAFAEHENCESQKENADADAVEEDQPSNADIEPTLPEYIQTINDILNEVLKFVSSSEKMHQILSLECLIAGIPLLKDYENELLPLVHLIWMPLVEKFRQKDAIVLNRCFTLLSILATYAKDFILKRSLNDVIPFLKQFLKDSAAHSAAETITVKTQEYKLQLKLLQEFFNLIQCMQIDGKHLSDIAESITLYLSKEQPKQLQDGAVQFYNSLKLYDAPLSYMIVLKKSHLKDYKENAMKVLPKFPVK